MRCALVTGVQTCALPIYYTIRPRICTSLWLGDRDAFTVKASVLDSHEVDRGDIFGYRGRSAPKSGTILIVSGGTAHGIGLEAHTGANTMKARASAIARAGMDAARSEERRVGDACVCKWRCRRSAYY